MNEQKAKELHQDLNQFLETTKQMVKEFHERINLMSIQAEVKQAVQPEQNGILVDYKTFSEIMNALSCAIDSGDAVYQPLYEKLLALGKAQSPAPVKPVIKQEPKAETTAKPELPPFMQRVLESLQAEARAHEAAATKKPEFKPEEADLESQIRKQFPGADIKVISNPMELMALLNDLSGMEDEKGKNRRF